MIPKFRQPAPALFASLERIRERLTAHAPVLTVEATIENAQRAHMVYRLHVRAADGVVSTIDFTDAFSRGLSLIALKQQPVDLKCEDVTVLEERR